MKIKKKPVKQILGGYSKKRAQKLRSMQEVTAPPPKEPVPEAPKVPPGIKDVLTIMGKLNRDISELTDTPYTVSIDLENGEWVLIVRGWEPLFEYYAGYKVRYVKSTFVRNPLANPMRRSK